MKIVVFSPYCLLRPTTNRIFDMRLCDAMSANGEEVHIVYPYTYMQDNISGKDIPAFYDLQNPVKTHMLPVPLRERSSKLSRFVLMMTAFGIYSFLILIGNLFSRKQLVLISRDSKLLVPVLLLRKLSANIGRWKVYFMAAEVKSNNIFKWVVRNSDGILAGVSTTRDAIMKNADVPADKFLLSLAPVPEYKNDPDKSAARRNIDYSSTAPLVVYTGKLGLEVQEVLYLLEAAKMLPDYRFIMTGGRSSVVGRVNAYCSEHEIKNVLLTGFFEDSRRIRDYQLAADVLVSYYTDKDHMTEYNYPQKVNEYLSTRNPVVTPDFPATRDVLNSNNVLFVEPNNAKALADGIRKLVVDKSLAQRLAAQAYEDVKGLTFRKRAAEFIAFMKMKGKY